MSDHLPQQPTWRRVFLGTQIINLVVTLLLWAISGELWINLIYSMVIGNIISVLINSSRLLLSAWLRRRPGASQRPELAHGWMGWRWTGPLVVVCGGLGYQLGMLVGNALTGRHMASPLSQGLRAWSGSGMVSIFASLIITWFFYSRAKLDAMEKQAARAAQLAAETQLRLLESQLEPHMLFNTLANLRALIGLDPQRAQQMLDRLIDFLRATLNASRVPLHDLSAEFQRVDDYLALMQIRMGARLRAHLDLPADLSALQIPPLLLQPLVENAIKHGLEPQRGAGDLWISARRQDDTLLLQVADSGLGLPTPPGPPGFGTQQVTARLHTLYGPRASLQLLAREGGGTLACIRLPTQPPATSSLSLAALPPCPPP